MAEPYLAHIAPDGREQTVLEHLNGTARLCAAFAGVFDAAPHGALAGLAHDIGKYTKGFQRRLHGGGKVDHSTAGKNIGPQKKQGSFFWGPIFCARF